MKKGKKCFKKNLEEEFENNESIVNILNNMNMEKSQGKLGSLLLN